MKIFALLYLSLLCSFNSIGQDVNALIKEGDRLEDIPNEIAAFNKFKEVLKLQPTNLYALSKSSELCSRIGQRQTVAKTRDAYYNAAKTYAELALKISPTNADAHCAMAIVLGRTSMSKSGKEKIVSAKEIKKHVDAALKSDPNNFKAWHVLGRWHYELSNLNMLERAAVKMLYGGLPAASLKESIRAFEKVQSITKGFILNHLELAKAYKRNDEDAKATALLKTMLALPNQTEDDPGIKELGRKLLKDLQ